MRRLESLIFPPTHLNPHLQKRIDNLWAEQPITPAKIRHVLMF